MENKLLEKKSSIDSSKHLRHSLSQTSSSTSSSTKTKEAIPLLLTYHSCKDDNISLEHSDYDNASSCNELKSLLNNDTAYLRKPIVRHTKHVKKKNNLSPSPNNLSNTSKTANKPNFDLINQFDLSSPSLLPTISITETIDNRKRVSRRRSNSTVVRNTNLVIKKDVSPPPPPSSLRHSMTDLSTSHNKDALIMLTNTNINDIKNTTLTNDTNNNNNNNNDAQIFNHRPWSRYPKSGPKYKLITEGDVNVCKLPYSRNVIHKILNSKLLRRWKSHKIILTESEIVSKTTTDYMEKCIPFSSIKDICPITKWEPGQKYCLKIETSDCLYLLQSNNINVRDQWLHSINWKRHKFKFEKILRVAVRPEILVKEIKNMVEMSLNVPIEDSVIYQFPLELISDILQQNHLLKSTHEEVIVAIGPLLEKNHPSPEICDFFSRHCRDSPRSKIVIEMFTPVVQRILKHNGDFGRYPRMRLFIQDYLMALLSQNAGLSTVQNFVITMHSTTSQCPFPRVLSNFVSVCLAAIHNCFEQRKNTSEKEKVNLFENDLEDQLLCFTTILYTISTYEDWRLNLGPLLQSIPFIEEALTHEKFIKIFKKVVQNVAEDNRCEVHQTLLGIRDGKEGWLEIFCPGGIACDDEGELFSIILNKLIGCCCKKKRFLLSINKLLSQIMLMALRENTSALETLCAMLDLDAIENRDHKLQVISTLQSTQTGAKMYSKVCERQIQLRELQQKGGPRKLTLPSRSTDADLAKLLSSGCFGNLECLSLAFTNVTSACAEHLIKLPSLKYLNLWSTQFGDQGLELVCEHLHRLQVLNLCETPVTDKGLAFLISLKQLRKLNLNSTNLSALTFENLKECLPALQECDVRYTEAW